MGRWSRITEGSSCSILTVPNQTSQKRCVYAFECCIRMCAEEGEEKAVSEYFQHLLTLVGLKRQLWKHCSQLPGSWQNTPCLSQRAKSSCIVMRLSKFYVWAVAKTVTHNAKEIFLECFKHLLLCCAKASHHKNYLFQRFWKQNIKEEKIVSLMIYLELFYSWILTIQKESENVKIGCD